MQLTPRQRRSLETICDTFCPPVEALPSASELGVPDAVLSLAGRDPRASSQRELKQLLGLWDTALVTALGGGGFKRFSALPREQRERVLLSWCDSRLPQRRAAFHGLRRAALTAYYGLPAPDGGRSPVWDAIDYPGPPGKPEHAPAKALTPLPITQDTTLDCDVCIVGSGAGGGVAAGVLSAAGLDVVVLERGGYYDDEDFDGGELSALSTMYSGAPAATHDGSVGLVAGSCLGGGTVVNFSTSFRTPDDVRAEWAAHGVPAFATAEFGDSLDAVCERLGVNQEHNDPSMREQKLRDACVSLGWHIDAMPRNVNGACDQGKDCGFCGFGCRRGAKQSTTKTWLVDAQAAEARIVVGAEVERVTVEGGVARGVSGRVGPHRLTVHSRAVVAACGALHTPALLKRSGLRNPNVGRNLRLHPVTAVWGIYDEEVRPWEGTMQALYSDQHRNLDGGYGVKYETAAGHPALSVAYMPWRGGRQHHELMQALAHTAVFGVLLRDRDGGEVRIDRDGEPVVRYQLSPYDLGHLRVGIEGAAQMHEAAGAQRIFSSQSEWVAYEPGAAGARGSRERFMRDADACGYAAGRLQLGSFHIMGSARMGGSPATSACDPNAQTWDVRDLYVLDGSAFPTSSGVNPQISIQAIAHMAARGLAARLD